LDISIDPFDINHVFISSYLNGLIEIQDDEIITVYDQNNSELETWFNAEYYYPTACLVSATDFDKEGNLWIANSHTYNRLKKLDKNGNWSKFSFVDLITANKFGLGDVMVDKSNDIWIGTRASGALIFNENGNKKAKLDSNADSGNLPSNMVKSFATDRNGNVWIGTTEGFRILYGVSRVFETPTPETQPVKIKLEGATGDEQAQIVLGEQPINSIASDGADNKWFGTNSSGVLGTIPSATESLYVFNKDNSPLPSNIINKIKVDNSTGKVYFATSNGVVAFNANVAPFGDELATTYAYPNPVTKDDEFVTIDGLNGKHLPRGTNVKILDSAGYLVYETNVVEGQEIKGGKVIWNKRNLANHKVASGVYVVLLTLQDTGETSVTKIAIIN
jgi:ligand-binding sensor domain-containing protein